MSLLSFATIAWKSAAIAIVSSTRVGISQIRNSSVGKYGCGRISHQIFLPSLIQPVFTSNSTYRWKLLYESKWSGMSVRGNCLKISVRYDFSPVLWPIQKGDEVES